MRRSLPGLAALAILLIPGIASAACGNDFDTARAKGFLGMYLAAFGFGFQTSLTPCVYPMIPITLGIFGARGKDVSRGRAVSLAAAYVFGMGLTYAAFGVIVALVGGGFGTQLANPFIVVPIVLMLLALAASMFGAFELNLPASWQAKLNTVGGQGYKGAFAMGMVGGFIAAPCTGPFLFGLLAFVSTTKSVVTGGSLLFVYALGMGVLFFAIAAFAISLPKSGRWMEWVKSAGGVLLMLAALYFLAPLIPALRKLQRPEVAFAVGAGGLAVIGIVLGALHLSFHGGRLEKLRKGAGVAAMTAGLFGVWSWYMAPKQELPWVHDESAAFAMARDQHKGVMIDFGASWCNPCRELEHTFGDPDVYRSITENFVPLKFDVSEDSPENDQRKLKYHAGGLPSVRYVTVDNKQLAAIDHMVTPDEMKTVLEPAIKGLKSDTLAASDCKNN